VAVAGVGVGGDGGHSLASDGVDHGVSVVSTVEASVSVDAGVAVGNGGNHSLLLGLSRLLSDLSLHRLDRRGEVGVVARVARVARVVAWVASVDQVGVRLSLGGGLGLSLSLPLAVVVAVAVAVRTVSSVSVGPAVSTVSVSMAIAVSVAKTVSVGQPGVSLGISISLSRRLSISGPLAVVVAIGGVGVVGDGGHSLANDRLDQGVAVDTGVAVDSGVAVDTGVAVGDGGHHCLLLSISRLLSDLSLDSRGEASEGGVAGVSVVSTGVTSVHQVGVGLSLGLSLRGGGSQPTESHKKQSLHSCC